MLIVKLIENSGFILLGSSAAGLFFLILKAKIRIRRERAAEAAKKAEKEAQQRARQAEDIRKAAELEAAEAAKKAEAARKKAEREAAAAAIRAEKQAAREAREAVAAARTAEKLETARLMAEYRERALAAARELKALETGRQDPPAEPSAAEPVREPAPDNGQKPFSGQKVSFTGRLKTMNRSQAAEMVRKAGGTAYIKAMPAGTTILVVGDVSGDGNTGKMDKADEWIGQVRKMYEPQFLAMFETA